VHVPDGQESRKLRRNIVRVKWLWFHRRNGIGVAFSVVRHRTLTKNGAPYMDLAIWIPAMVILGLVTMGLMFAFLEACEKV
jgi:hypothetical protein